MKRHHITPDVVTMIEQLRAGAAVLVHSAFNGRQKCVEMIPGFYREAVTRACSAEDNASPLLKLAGWLMTLCMIGRVDAAQSLVDFLQDVIDRFDNASRDIPTVSLAEQREEAHETNYQLEYSAGNHAVRPQWIASLRRERALSSELLRALEAEEAEDRKRKAAA